VSPVVQQKHASQISPPDSSQFHVDGSVNIADPKEAQRQRKREWYAKNKEEISKRRRQARELKKQTLTPIINENTIWHIPGTGQTGVTQLQYGTPSAGHVFLTRNI
jgi:hypothetical protein